MKFLLITIFFSLTVFTAFSQDSINRIYYSNGSLRSFQIEKDSIFIYEKSFYENGEVAGEGVGRINLIMKQNELEVLSNLFFICHTILSPNLLSIFKNNKDRQCSNIICFHYGFIFSAIHFYQ